MKRRNVTNNGGTNSSGRKLIVRSLIAGGLVILAGALRSKAADLKPETVKAWDQYIHAENLQAAERARSSQFLWSDESQERLRRLHNGEILVEPVGKNPVRVPNGLIHHWVGAAFLPGVHVEDVISVVRDYNRYKDFYAPNVIESESLHRASAGDEFSLLMLNKALLAKFALAADFQDKYVRLDDKRWYGVSYSSRIREIDHYGEADQRELPPNTGIGFIWRLYSISRFEQRDGGVYVELEAVALSRDIPAGLHWFVNPIVRRVSKGSLVTSLEKTQEAVRSTEEVASRAKDAGDAQDSALVMKTPTTLFQNGFAMGR